MLVFYRVIIMLTEILRESIIKALQIGGLFVLVIIIYTIFERQEEAKQERS